MFPSPKRELDSDEFHTGLTIPTGAILSGATLPGTSLGPKDPSGWPPLCSLLSHFTLFRGTQGQQSRDGSSICGPTF